MSKIILVTGGARSGKSLFAEDVVKGYGSNICYIATALAFDEGMADRIKKHRAQRPDDWHTLEAYHGFDSLIRDRAGAYDAYLLDCMTLMVTNLMFKDMPDFDTLDYGAIDAIEADIHREVDQMIKAFRDCDDTLVIVTNELGSGIVPENKLARIYRDMAGRINQKLGHMADQVYLVVCGQALKIKG